MCDQTEVTYSPGDVVWVKLGPVWWPGQVQDYDTLNEEITSNLKKKPLAVVKFFQEDSFEYVKNLNHIYRYNCHKKEEFIRKGLDMVRSSNSRDVPSNMKMFPNDVVMAEHLTGGNPNILDEQTYAPEQKSNYSNLFGPKKLSGKKVKSDCKKEQNIPNLKKKVAITPMKSRRSLPAMPSSVPRPITHPRFIVKALEGRSDHEVRIRCQFSSFKNDEEVTPKKYTCHICGFQAARLNVIILHNKSHSAGFADAYKIKPQIKFEEREPALPEEQNSFSENTPTVITSRGRVKVLPKKLLDYTDEPPPKMLKEKASNKSSSEKTPNVLKRSAEKMSTKKEKDSPEKVPAKRPLFGKRKSVKEKAELAAKQKQENEAMKETLLKDWDDDDVNQEEVELERLKLALESTSSDISDDNSISLENSKMESSDTEDLEVTTDSKPAEATKLIKTDGKAEVFEFDDSEDSFPVAINFRPKSQREQKFTDDKFKKPKPPKPLSRISSKNKSSVSNLPTVASPSQDGSMEKNNQDIENKTEDLETAELNDAFNALLQETAVPDIPEIPKSLNSTLSDQTSDISSTTDLMADPECIKTEETAPNIEAAEISQSCDADNSLKVECSSSGRDLKSTFEGLNPMENSSSTYNSSKINYSETQKNANSVSTFDPRVEMDSQFLSSGVSPTTVKNETEFEIVSADDKLLQTFESAVEITSSCDLTKTNDQSQNFDESNKKTAVVLSGENTSTECPSESVESIEGHSNVPANEVSVEHKLNMLNDSQTDCSLSEFGLNKETDIDADVRHQCLTDDMLSDHEHIAADNKSCDVMSQKSDEPTTLIDEKEEEKRSNESSFGSLRTLVKLEENSASQFGNSLESEVQKTVTKQDGSQLDSISSAASNSNVQLLLPVSSEYNTVHLISQNQSSTQHINTFVPKHELSQACPSNQDIGQNLQDMELDINSMPVIIGEDFIQPEDTKNVVQIQPNYSESILVSPKTVPSPSTPEGLIMKIEVPTSSQHLQPLMNIPSKSTRVKGGKAQKTMSKTIKLSASTLKNLGNLHKGGNQQVLILKTASGQDKLEGSPDKSKPALNMVQHGNKILILNNAQMSGPNAIAQQLLSGGKLSHGTRVFTSKVVSTTSSTQVSPNISNPTLSRSPSKPTKKIVFNQAGGILATTSKNVIINSSSGKLMTVPSTQTVTSSIGKNLMTHNIVGSKSSLILPNPSHNSAPMSKPSNVLTSQTLSASQSTMILAPIASKGGTVLAGNQKLRIVSSKAPISGTRFVVQNSPGKFSFDPLNKNQQLKLVSGLKGAQGNTFLIKTSQGIFTKPMTTSSITMAAKQPTIRASSTSKTILTTIPTQAKISGAVSKTIQPLVVQHSKVLQQPQIVQSKMITTPKMVQQSQILLPQAGQTQFEKQDQLGKKSQTVKRLGVQKSRQSPNIIQKTPRKTTPRTPKPRGNRFISPAIEEPVVMQNCSNIPVVGHTTMAQGQITQNPDVLYLTVDESGNYRPLDNKTLVNIEGGSETPSSLFIPANNQPQDVGNIFIAIDESGNIINITQPAPNVSVSSQSTSGQDILAKALENTQVLQQETIIPDIDITEALGSSSVESLTSCTMGRSFSDRSQYTPTLSHNVLETSLTLNQPPIMTPLEVPSIVSPNLGSMSALPSNFIGSDLLSTKSKPLSPSMPLLTEESLSNQNHSEQVFLLDSSNLPSASGSQLSLQLALNDGNVIVSSGSGCASIAPSFRVVSGDMIPSELDMSNEVNNMQNIVQEECIIDQECVKVESEENVSLDIHTEQYQETLETPQIQESYNSIVKQEALDSPQENVTYPKMTGDISSFQPDNEKKLEIPTEKKHLYERFEDEQSVINNETIYTFSEDFNDQDRVGEENDNLFKRGLEEERTVSSSSDLDDDPKRMKIDER